ncbi:MAG: hypothetical protein HYS51_00475 [Candidatus Zambryskibacteria bacterium]|nr:hypothetical protein [Candidatus Zambryskibacteria bacterium]
MGIKDFFLKQVLKHKMKDMPEAEREKLLALMEAHPEFFKKISEEVKKKTKAGMSEMAATMVVMRRYQAELQKLMQK